MDEEKLKGWVNSMKKKLDSISESTPPPFHICRVPSTIRNKDNHVYYDPKIVSIGPFHRGSTNLQAMEEHKWRYLHKVLHHCPSLEECVKTLTEIPLEKTRKCYSGNINMPDDEFVEMMLLDGSFIIQLLLLRKEIEEDDDPILRNIWMMPAIAADMLLLENQIPFFVLECLAKCIGYDANELNVEAFLFLSKYLPDTLDFEKGANNETLVHKTSQEIHHLLHLVHWSLKLPNTEKPFCAQPLQVVRKILSFLGLRCLANDKNEYEMLPTEDEQAGASSITVQHQEAGASSITVQHQEAGASSNTEQTQERVNPIPTATELEEAGVGFIEGGSFLDVKFKNGVLRLPRLQITDYTNSVFRNIIAFEQCFPDSGGAITSYCILIDSLVNTPRDVQILKQSHIIESKLGSDEEVAVLFNQLLKGIAGSLNTGSVRKASIDVSNYAKNRWPRWRATLKRDYFSNPWAAFAFIAAVYALFLSSVGTYYAAKVMCLKSYMNSLQPKCIAQPHSCHPTTFLRPENAIHTF